MKKNVLIILLLNFSIIFCHPVIENIDLNKFMGRWYVFALIPNWIEEGGINSYDDYVLNDDGTIYFKKTELNNIVKFMVNDKTRYKWNPGFIISPNIVWSN